MRPAEAVRNAAEQQQTALARQDDNADRRYEGLLAALACGGFTATDARLPR
ncbi:hypothetical protein [Dactylosporangium sp. NPDC051484]|uniref:hypothetical protein n=1 Tax=Dactylosporangium sp. NPDC051484 TaxID=3154942 RepID=UPI00344B4E7E